MHSLDKDGFEIVADVLDTDTVENLARNIEESQITRSRAGMRRAMQIDAVSEIAADPRLMKFVNAALGSLSVPRNAVRQI